MFKKLWVLALVSMAFLTMVFGSIGWIVGFLVDLATEGSVDTTVFVVVGGVIGFLLGSGHLVMALVMRKQEKDIWEQW
ncbi:hypothetical protein B0H94_11834 [Salsuginibacillus halophilus]|uniref:Uncharacterized protein n=1 Tax=Salsuginibacillus halophilus TaxID=517424 RepID=A0A2P8H690_9BACI|nr:hypothetical protein [Salsuginibacillus halophilus]PSL41721.1 hypothetical protein B0H94_11834 [Salsuginibacillus halophilus]